MECKVKKRLIRPLFTIIIGIYPEWNVKNIE